MVTETAEGEQKTDSKAEEQYGQPNDDAPFVSRINGGCIFSTSAICSRSSRISASLFSSGTILLSV